MWAGEGCESFVLLSELLCYVSRDMIELMVLIGNLLLYWAKRRPAFLFLLVFPFGQKGFLLGWVVNASGPGGLIGICIWSCISAWVFSFLVQTHLSLAGTCFRLKSEPWKYSIKLRRMKRCRVALRKLNDRIFLICSAPCVPPYLGILPTWRLSWHPLCLLCLRTLAASALRDSSTRWYMVMQPTRL